MRTDAKESQDPVPSPGVGSRCWGSFEQAQADFTEGLCGASSTFSVKTLPRYHLKLISDINDTFNGLLVRNQMAFSKLEPSLVQSLHLPLNGFQCFPGCGVPASGTSALDLVSH